MRVTICTGCGLSGNTYAFGDNGRACPVCGGALALMDNFLEHYIMAALWSSTDGDGTPLDANYTAADIAPATLLEMRADCEAFQTQAAGLYTLDEETHAAHDFWLTRNGHGAGFWDGDWKEPGASQLDTLAKGFGEYELYIGDDGKIHGMGD